MPKKTQPIRLNLQLFDGATNKFVRAVLTDAAGVAVAGSPVALTHISNGLYQNDSILMPDTAQVQATYIVYDDAGFTTESVMHSRSLDVFDLEVGDAGEQNLKGVVTGGLLKGSVREC